MILFSPMAHGIHSGRIHVPEEPLRSEAPISGPDKTGKTRKTGFTLRATTPTTSASRSFPIPFIELAGRSIDCPHQDQAFDQASIGTEIRRNFIPDLILRRVEGPSRR